MKKLIFLLCLGYLPYLFLFTSVEDVKDSDREYNCYLETLGVVKQTIGFGSVYYRPIGISPLDNYNIVLPYFFQQGEIAYAQCADIEIGVGHSDNLKAGSQITVITNIRDIKLFGYKLFSETGWSSFGINADKNFQIGERILTKLVDDKEVQFFHGKRINK